MTSSPPDHLQRAISARQLGMIAIGGAIGTGLFLASGSAIARAGPAGALLAYAVMGLAVFCMMQSLGEMATQLPIAGSFEAYAERFLHPSLGFALGWNYWFSWAITLAAELVASGLIVRFWFPDSNPTHWAVGFFVVLLAMNLLSVKVYAEAEYWLASVKVGTVLIFVGVGALMACGMLGDSPAVGFANWFAPGADAGKPGHGGVGLAAILSVFLVAGFSFLGTEGVGMAAAETKDPAIQVPRAIRSVFWRITLFYIGSIAIIGCLIPANAPGLLSNDGNITLSPFTMVFERIPRVGHYAAHVMNFVILSAVLSAGNSSLYLASRMLFAMAHNRKAPRALGDLSARGVPVKAVVATGLVGATAFFASTIGEQKIYQLLYNASSVTGFIVWLGIAACHLRFRRAWVAQGRALGDLKFRARWFPWAQILTAALFVVVIFGANAELFDAAPLPWFDIVTSYAAIPAFALLFIGHRWARKATRVELPACKLDPGD